MRIRELRLIAFGPFTDRRIAFEGDGVLHIVYGQNEAGKSSSLRALSQWLYGIAHQSDDDFVHPKSSLRIGGILANERSEHYFERRKGTSKTLRDASDRVLDDNCLREFLGGLDEQIFTTRFAIDYAELRRGGQAAAIDGGDVAETLFAAGSGIANLRPLQEKLLKELGDLFKSGGSKPRINEHLRKIKELKGEIRTLQLPDSQYNDREQALQVARKQQEELDSKRSNLRTQEQRLNEIYQAGPKVQRLGALRREFDSLTALPELSDGFESDWRATRQALESEESNLTRLHTELKTVRSQVATFQIHPRILEFGPAIDHLHERRGSYNKSKSDRQKRVAELEQVRQLLNVKRAELGPLALDEFDERWNLPPIERNNIQTLANEGKMLAERRRLLQEQIDSLQLKCQRLENELVPISEVPDYTPLVATVKAASRLLDLETQTASLQTQVQQLETQQAVELAKLNGWNSDAERLMRVALPSVELIDSFDTEWQQANLQRNAAKMTEAELRKKLNAKTRILDKFIKEHDVPTLEELERVRLLRDAAIRLLIGEKTGATEDVSSAADLIAEFSPGGNLAQTVQSAVLAADRIADQLRIDADRVAEKVSLTTEIEELNQQISETLETIANAESATAAIDARWIELWKPLGIVPKPPREMRAWIPTSQRVNDLTERLSQARTDLANRRTLIDTTRRELQEQMARVGAPRIDVNLSLSAMILTAEEYLQQLEQARTTRLTKQKDLDREQNELLERQTKFHRAEQELSDWLDRWQKAVLRLRLPDAWDLEMVLKYLETANEIAACLSQLKNLEHRVAGIDRDEQEFICATKELFKRLDLPEFTDSVEQAVEMLFQKRRAAEKDQVALEKCTMRAMELETEIIANEQSVTTLRNKLNALCQQANAKQWDDVPIAIASDRRRRELRHEIRQLEEDLLLLAAGRELNEFITEVLHTDFNELNANRELLRSQINDVEQEFKSVSEKVGSLRNEFAKFDGSSRASEKEEELQMVTAKLRNDVEEYSRLRLALALLDSAMEAYQEKTQGPVLKLASEYFRKLTLGAYLGLKTEFDSKGRAILVGERASPRRQVPVEGLSDGTCDQLYLSVRLALLEHYLQSHAPVPFIVDDILVMFDDHRALAALEALVDLASKTQVIYFTHHQHLVSLAQSHFGPRVAIQTLG